MEETSRTGNETSGADKVRRFFGLRVVKLFAVLAALLLVFALGVKVGENHRDVRRSRDGFAFSNGAGFGGMGGYAACGRSSRGLRGHAAFGRNTFYGQNFRGTQRNGALPGQNFRGWQTGGMQQPAPQQDQTGGEPTQPTQKN